MKKFYLIISCLIFFGSVQAQQIPNWGSFYDNGFIWNPALTAKWNMLEVTANHRSDWSSFDDAPQTSSIGFQVPFLRKITKVSMGSFLERDQVGPFSKYTMAYTYSYRIVPNLLGNYKDQLRLGVSANLHQFQYNPNKLNPFDGFEFDRSLLEQADEGIGINITVGAFYLSIDDFDNWKSHYYVGLAINQVLPGKLGRNILGEITSQQHASLHLGYRYLRSKRSRFYYEPNLLITYSLDKTINAMANLKYEQQDAYWMTMGLVTNGEVFFQAGLILTEDSFLGGLVGSGHARMGVKVDYTVLKLRGTLGMGYELYLAYYFDKEKKW